MASNSRIQLEGYLKTIEVKADAVLDIAGAQKPIKGRTKSWDVKEYVITDLVEPHETMQPADVIWDVNDESGWLPESLMNRFDVAFCIELMEYTYQPLSVIRKIYDALKTGGVLYISFQFVYPTHSPEGQDYLRFTRWGAIKLLETAGFKIDDTFIRRCEAKVSNGKSLLEEMYAVEQMRARKRYDHSEVAFVFKAIKK